jgi:hypothetical protein
MSPAVADVVESFCAVELFLSEDPSVRHAATAPTVVNPPPPGRLPAGARLTNLAGVVLPFAGLVAAAALLWG